MIYLWLALISSALAALTDVRKGIIPNSITYTTFLVVLILTAIDSSRDFSTTLAGFGLGFSIPLILFLTGHLGGGDLKLLGALGAAVGFPMVLSLLLWTCAFGFFVALAYVVIRGKLKELLLDIYEIIVVSLLSRMGRSAAPLYGHTIPLGVGIFFAVATLTIFPDRANILSFV